MKTPINIPATTLITPISSTVWQFRPQLQKSQLWQAQPIGLCPLSSAFVLRARHGFSIESVQFFTIFSIAFDLPLCPVLQLWGNIRETESFPFSATNNNNFKIPFNNRIVVRGYDTQLVEPGFSAWILPKRLWSVPSWARP